MFTARYELGLQISLRFFFKWLIMHLNKTLLQKDRFQWSNHLNCSEILQITNNPVLYLRVLCPCSLFELWPQTAAQPNFPQLSVSASVSKGYRTNCGNYNLLFISPYKKTLRVRHVKLQTRRRDATKFQRVAWLPPSGGRKERYPVPRNAGRCCRLSLDMHAWVFIS